MLNWECIDKKLIEAAQHWARRPSKARQDPKFDDPPEWQAAIEAREQELKKDDDVDDGYFAVWPENWDAVIVFCNLRHCWRVDTMSGGYLGLDRPAIESTLRLMDIKKKKHTAIFEKLMIMEDAALGVLNK